jgi:hypothetical protein
MAVREYEQQNVTGATNEGVISPLAEAREQRPYPAGFTIVERYRPRKIH